jgi:2-polyprenyl-3-methyl-5-hydroxy-6-metoxy-1,4-benzoquinol methylase
LFENFSPNVKYDNIILGHVLEHVDDPVKIISLASNWLSDRGRILASVPNSQSLHRQAAVIMGLLSFEEELNESDLHHGHRRVFNPKTFSEVFHKAGLKIDANGGYWLKPISNSQIEANWSQQMLNAFLQLGESYPDIAGEIYIVASNAK